MKKCLIVIMITMMAVFAACNDGQQAGESRPELDIGDACLWNTDCGTELVCVDGKCQKPGASGDGGLLPQENQDLGGNINELESGGVTTSSAPSSIDVSPGMPSDGGEPTPTDDGEPTPADPVLPAGCSADVDCPAEQVCTNGACVAATPQDEVIKTPSLEVSYLDIHTGKFVVIEHGHYEDAKLSTIYRLRMINSSASTFSWALRSVDQNGVVLAMRNQPASYVCFSDAVPAVHSTVVCQHETVTDTDIYVYLDRDRILDFHDPSYVEVSVIPGLVKDVSAKFQAMLSFKP